MGQVYGYELIFRFYMPLSLPLFFVLLVPLFFLMSFSSPKVRGVFREGPESVHLLLQGWRLHVPLQAAPGPSRRAPHLGGRAGLLCRQAGQGRCAGTSLVSFLAHRNATDNTTHNRQHETYPKITKFCSPLFSLLFLLFSFPLFSFSSVQTMCCFSCVELHRDISMDSLVLRRFPSTWCGSAEAMPWAA